jgi:16S rRNA (uracil1498-N3)-methyltransferase
MPSAADAAPSFLHLAALPAVGAESELPEDEARYVARVVRARAGETLTATDGEGGLARLRVEATRPAVVVLVLERSTAPRPADAVLWCGAPEGERGDWLVEKCAELGVTRLVPVDCDRARWGAAARAERWQRLAVAALRQSRSPWRLRLEPPTPLAALAGTELPPARWLADPDGSPVSGRTGGGAVVGAVGPSSGFSDEERKFLSGLGFSPVSLAGARLRTETAALAMAAAWAAARSERGGRP